MEFVIGVLLLLTFVCLVVYAVKGGNMALGVLIMATSVSYTHLENTPKAL